MVNLGKIKAAHKGFIKAHASMVQTELEAAGQVGADHPRQHATFKRRTGGLQDATRHKVVRTRGGYLVRILNPKKYAPYIEYGTRPHPITAPEGRFLRFRGKSGQFIFRKAVMHKGTKPYKFLYRAMFAAYRAAGPNLQDGMRRVAKKF